MDIQVLVTHATKCGATTEIADKVGQVLRDGTVMTSILSRPKCNEGRIEGCGSRQRHRLG
jgi:hypothetical protein